MRRSLLRGDERTVTFTYQDRASGQTRTLRLSGQEFLRRFLQHRVKLRHAVHYVYLANVVDKRTGEPVA